MNGSEMKLPSKSNFDEKIVSEMAPMVGFVLSDSQIPQVAVHNGYWEVFANLLCIHILCSTEIELQTGFVFYLRPEIKLEFNSAI